LELPSQHELHLAVWRLLAVCSVAYQIDTYSANTSRVRSSPSFSGVPETGEWQGPGRAAGKRSHGQGLDAVVEDHATEEAITGLTGEAAQPDALGRLNAGRSFNLDANKLAMAIGDHDIHLQLILVAIPCRDT
jgi:hypothetical protein